MQSSLGDTMHVCLILGPCPPAGAAGSAIDVDRTEQQLIRPALAACVGLSGQAVRTTRLQATVPLASEALAELLAAELVLCDITHGHGAVGYALGLRHALRRGHALLIRGVPRSPAPGQASPGAAPFLPGPLRVLDYDPADPAAAVPALQAEIEDALRSSSGTDSPVYLLMPALREATPPPSGLAPLQQLQAVARAEQRGDRGALRLMADTTPGQPLPAALLQALARAQARLDDPDGACRSWQQLLAQGGADAESLLGLARLHLDLYARRGSGADLAAAQQALEALASLPEGPCLPAGPAAEAAVLAAQVRLQQWRKAWQGQANPRERRRRAACAALHALPSACMHAQRLDLHAVPVTMAALHALRAMALLSADDDCAARLHARPSDARDALAVLERDTECLRMLATLALQRLDQLPGTESAAIARLARAELRWLDATEATHPELAAGRVREALIAATPPPGDSAAHALARALRERLEDAAALGLDTIAAAVLVGLGGWGASPAPGAGRHVVLALDGRAEPAASGTAPERAMPEPMEQLAQRLGSRRGAPAAMRLVAAARTAWEHQVRDLAETLGWSTEVLGAWDEPPPAPSALARRWMLHAAAALAPASVSLLLPSGTARSSADACLQEARTLLGPAVQVELLE